MRSIYKATKFFPIKCDQFLQFITCSSSSSTMSTIQTPTSSLLARKGVQWTQRLRPSVLKRVTHLIRAVTLSPCIIACTSSSLTAAELPIRDMNEDWSMPGIWRDDDVNNTFRDGYGRTRRYYIFRMSFCTESVENR